VSICVTSPHHNTSGAIAVKLRRARSARSGAAGLRPGRVSDLRLLGGRPAGPSSTIRAATVLAEIFQPASRRSSVILGDP
jgi:hypothetical protein